MNTSVALVLALVVCLSAAAAAVYQTKLTLTHFEFTDCGRLNNDPIVFNSFSMTPDPIVVPGTVTVNGQIGSGVTVTSPSSLHLKVYEIIAGFPVEIPCVHQQGSCDYDDICALLDQMFDPSQPCPPFFQQHEFPCHCPLPSKTYTLDNVNFPVNGSLMVAGDYQVTTKLNDKDYQELACAQITFSVVKASS